MNESGFLFFLDFICQESLILIIIMYDVFYFCFYFGVLLLLSIVFEFVVNVK